MVDIYGKPKVKFNTKEEIDLFIDDVEKILKDNLR